MKIRCIVYLILMIACGSCIYSSKETIQRQNNEKSYPHNINIEEGVNCSVELKLSDIADSIKYVVLSKNKEVVIKNFLFLQSTDTEFYINIKGLWYRFDHDGNFLNTIGKAGRGPEEYLPGSPLAASPTQDIVYVKRNYLNDYVSYNSSGLFVGEVPLKCSENI